MPKYQVFILSNIMLLIFLYICGVISSATFAVFDWNEDCRIVISLFYGLFAIILNGIILMEDKK